MQVIRGIHTCMVSLVAEGTLPVAPVDGYLTLQSRGLHPTSPWPAHAPSSILQPGERVLIHPSLSLNLPVVVVNDDALLSFFDLWETGPYRNLTVTVASAYFIDHSTSVCTSIQSSYLPISTQYSFLPPCK